MIQKNIYDRLLELQKLQKENENQLLEYGKQFIGMNFYNSLEMMKDEMATVYVKRGNITFITHYPRRTKRPNLEIQKNGYRENLISVKNVDRYKSWNEFNANIKDVYVVSEICSDKRLTDRTTCVPTLKFILDDIEEFVVEQTN